ncbi:hypothetical protein ScalyP_jg447 [Parmales sp. scaly parma]|nr:hypothetical protein ScalyP_jg447 [Parmales sp. scaly parma]
MLSQCTGPVECKHFLRVAREQNDNTYREGVWICDGPCGNKHYARNNPQDQGIFRCETCKIDLDMTCVKMPQMQVQMQMPTGQQPMAMGQPLPMMMQPPMGGGQPMMIQPQGGQPMMMQMPMGGQQPMMMQPQQ